MSKSAVKSYAMFGVGTPPNRVPGQDMATSQTSDVSVIQRMDNVEILVSWTGASPVGTLTVERSHDQIIWRALDFGTAIPISGNSGHHEIDITQLAAPFIRCVYTAVSGAGTIFADISSKSLSGGAN